MRFLRGTSCEPDAAGQDSVFEVCAILYLQVVTGYLAAKARDPSYNDLVVSPIHDRSLERTLDDQAFVQRQFTLHDQRAADDGRTRERRLVSASRKVRILLSRLS